MKQVNIIFVLFVCVGMSLIGVNVAVAETRYKLPEDAFKCLVCDDDECDKTEQDFEDNTITVEKSSESGCKTKINIELSDNKKVTHIQDKTCYKDQSCFSVSYKGEKPEIDPSSPLYKAMVSKTVKPDGLCVSTLGENNFEKDGDCTYVSPDFGICDTHAYNAGESTNPEGSADRDFIRDVVGLKVTVISQQMYKQYEYLSATLKRLKTQLEKSVLNAKLEMAGAHSESSSGGSSSGGYKTYLAGADNCNTKGSKDSAYSCLQSNTSLILTAASNNTKQACNQFADTYNAAKTWEVLNDQNGNAQDLKVGTSNFECKDIKNKCNKNNLIDCAQALNVKIINKRDDLTKSQGRGLYIGGL